MPSAISLPKFSTISRLTTATSAFTICSIQTIVRPLWWMPRIVSTSSSHSPWVSPPAISSSSSRRGLVASARAISSRLRSSSGSAPLTRLALAARPVCSRISPTVSTTSASRLPWPKQAATSKFSATVSFSKGCGTWCERQMPARQRFCAECPVMSWPSSAMVPALGGVAPVISENSVVLPAPFGPMMPSASPSAIDSDTPSVTTSEP